MSPSALLAGFADLYLWVAFAHPSVLLWTYLVYYYHLSVVAWTLARVELSKIARVLVADEITLQSWAFLCKPFLEIFQEVYKINFFS